VVVEPLSPLPPGAHLASRRLPGGETN